MQNQAGSERLSNQNPADLGEPPEVTDRRLEEYKLLRAEAMKRMEFRYARVQLTNPVCR